MLSVNHQAVSRSVWDFRSHFLPLDSFTVSLHSSNGRHLPAIRAVQGDCLWPLKNGRNFHQSHNPIIHCNQSIPQPINQPIAKEWRQTVEGHVTYTTDSFTSPRQGLRNSPSCPGSTHKCYNGLYRFTMYCCECHDSTVLATFHGSLFFHKRLSLIDEAIVLNQYIYFFLRMAANVDQVPIPTKQNPVPFFTHRKQW